MRRVDIVVHRKRDLASIAEGYHVCAMSYRVDAQSFSDIPFQGCEEGSLLHGKFVQMQKKTSTEHSTWRTHD